MIVPALLTVAVATSGTGAPAPTELEAFTSDASAMLLEGRELPADYRHRLRAMSPGDRLQAIVFLRRSGLLSGDLWSLEDILRPPEIHSPENPALHRDAE